jgi:hypothetical protein
VAEATYLAKLGDETLGNNICNFGKRPFQGRLYFAKLLKIANRSVQSIECVVDAGMNIGPDGVMEQLRYATITVSVHGLKPYTNQDSAAGALVGSSTATCLSALSIVSASPASLRVVSANSANPAEAANIRTDVTIFISFLPAEFSRPAFSLNECKISARPLHLM